MLKYYYRWLYYFKQRRESRNRLSGKVKRQRLFRIFQNEPFERSEFGKYDLPQFKRRRNQVIVAIPLCIFGIWFFIESIQAIGIFQ